MDIQRFVDVLGSILAILVPILAIMVVIYLGLCLINQRRDRRW